MLFSKKKKEKKKEIEAELERIMYAATYNEEKRIHFSYGQQEYTQYSY